MFHLMHSSYRLHFINFSLITICLLGVQHLFSQEIWHKMEGNWIAQIADHSFSETWRMRSDTLWGKSIERNAMNQIEFEENMHICTQCKNPAYVVNFFVDGKSLSHQFQATCIQKNSIIFEDPLHDFPQQIKYRILTPKKMIAIVKGIEDKKPKKLIFRFKKSEKQKVFEEN
jgi:hypothetical protein